MNSKKDIQIKIIMETLNKLYPNPPIPLDPINNFTLLVAVVLSAQSTDKKVNELTPSLFEIASNPFDMAILSEKEIHNKINQ